MYDLIPNIEIENFNNKYFDKTSQLMANVRIKNESFYKQLNSRNCKDDFKKATLITIPTR